MSDAKPSEIVPAPQSNPLRPDDLATRINAAHEEVKNSIRRGAEHAIKAGQLLLQAKEIVGHGVFLEWVGEHCHCTPRTAQLYMKLAKEKDKLAPNAKSISHLTLTEAMEMLGPLKQKLAEEKPPRPPAPDPVAAAITKDALDILRRAWNAAGEPQRKIV
jgi:hypothetical protein